MARTKAKAKRGHAGQLARLRALAHPLRLRVYQEFAAGRRTTRQVATLLGEPPTRLYHHVNLLGRVGLLRLVETRPNRGTVEKYFEVASGVDTRGETSGLSRAGRRLRSSLATLVLDETRLELLAALDARRRSPSGVAKEVPLTVARGLIPGTPAQITRLRRALIAQIKRHSRAHAKRSPSGARLTPDDQECWSLTLAILPLPGRPVGKKP